MDNNIPARHHETNVNVINWTATIFGIPWTVWWAFVIQSWLVSKHETINILSIEISKDIFLSASALFVGIFVLSYSRWLWTATYYGQSASVRKTLRDMSRTFYLGTALVGIVTLIDRSLNPGSNTFFSYGLVLTVFWIVSPAIQSIYFYK